LGEASRFYRFGDEFARFRHAMVKRRGGNILHDDRDAARGTLIGNAATHDACPATAAFCTGLASLA